MPRNRFSSLTGDAEPGSQNGLAQRVRTPPDHHRKGQPWTEEEDSKVLVSKAGAADAKLSAEMGRSVVEIEDRRTELKARATTERSGAGERLLSYPYEF